MRGLGDREATRLHGDADKLGVAVVAHAEGTLLTEHGVFIVEGRAVNHDLGQLIDEDPALRALKIAAREVNDTRVGRRLIIANQQRVSIFVGNKFTARNIERNATNGKMEKIDVLLFILLLGGV